LPFTSGCGLQPLEGDAGLDAAKGIDPGMDAAVLIAIGEEPERHEDVAAGEKTKVLRQHADDGIAVAAELDGLADHAGVAAEPALPEAVAEDHRARGPGLVVIGSVEAAEERLHAGERQQVGGGHAAQHALRLARGSEIEALAARGGEAGKEVARLRAPVEIVEPGAGRMGEVGRGLVEDDHALRIGKGHRPQEREADHAEEHRVGADAERQREHRDGRESGRFAQGTKAVPQVLP
jgi:hypothetical protein